MIGRLSGKLVAKRPPTLLVDVGGVGYEVEAPMSTIFELPPVGEPVSLLTHLVVRDDAHLLFGFRTEDERDAFRQLIRVSGVGARIALSLLSGMSVEELGRAVATQDVARLTRVPGIGKKTAERLLLELRGKLGAELDVAAAPVAGGQADILNALISLGYSSAESQKALKSLPPDVDVAEGIRLALKSLAR